MGKIFKDTDIGITPHGSVPKTTTVAGGGSGKGSSYNSNDQKTKGITPGSTKTFTEDLPPTEKKMGSLLGAKNTIEKPTKI